MLIANTNPAVLSHIKWKVRDAAYVAHFAHFKKNHFVMGYRNGQIKIIDPESEQLFTSPESEILSLTVLKNKRIVSTHQNGMIYFWNSELRQPEFKFKAGHIVSLLELPDRTIAAGMKHSNIKIFNPRKQEFADDIGLPSWYVGDMLTLLERGIMMSFRRDMGMVYLWEIEHKKRKKWFQTRPDLYAAAMLSDGCNLATSHRDGLIYIWDIQAEQCVATFAGSSSLVHSLVALPDNHLAAGDADGNIKIWDTRLRQCKMDISVKLIKNNLPLASYVNHTTMLADGRLAYITNHEIGVIPRSF